MKTTGQSLVAFFIFCAMNHVFADTFTVTVSQGNQAGSLPWAVAQATQKSGEHRIIFDKSTDNDPIVLKEAIRLEGSIEITGNGPDRTKIDGDGKTRLFLIDSAQSNIKLAHLLLQNGRVQEARGMGGAILMTDGKLAANGVSFVGNMADLGALVVQKGEATLEDVSWHNQQTKAFVLLGGKAKLRHNHFSDNQEGCINALGGVLDVDESIFTDNKASTGTALYIRNTQVLLNRVTIENNAAIDGDLPGKGGLTTSGMGGAMLVSLGADVKVENSTLAGNKADHRGGAIYVNGGGKLSIANSTLSGNRSLQAGAIAIYGGAVDLDASTVAFNQVESGLRAAIWVKGAPSQSKIDIRNSIVARTEGLDGKPTWDIGSESANSFTIHDSIIESPGQSAPEAAADRHQMQSNPKVGPLANNGGTTRTHALLDGSPAIDAVTMKNPYDDKEEHFDQRGFPRIKGKAQDIGSFERQVTENE